MKLFSTTLVVLLCSTGLSMAAITTDAVVADLQAQGYTNIEVRTGPTQVKVEAVRGTEQLEVVYDKATGEVLKQESGLAGAEDDLSTGVSLRDEDEDFVGGDVDDDGSVDDGDDDSAAHGGGSDDASDSGDDHGGHGEGEGAGHGGGDGRED